MELLVLHLDLVHLHLDPLRHRPVQRPHAGRLRQVPLGPVLHPPRPGSALFVYLIARGKSMGERQMAAMAEAQAQQEKYIQGVAAKTKTPAEQIADAKGLLDSGAITQAEFDALKAKALAS